MKIMMMAIAISLSGLITSATNAGIPVLQAEQQNMTDQKMEGTVSLNGDTWIIQVKNGGENIDYMPLNLSAEYKVEGLRVVFSATPVSPPENVRLIGKPVKITAIKKA